MLVLGRHLYEGITIETPDAIIRITVVRLGPEQVRLAFEAPANCRILRDDAINKEPSQCDS